MEYSTWVSLMRWPFFSRVRLRVFSRKGGWLMVPAAADQGVHPGGKLRRGEGLGHIVVGPVHQARDLVHLLGPGRQHDDADAGIGGPDAAAYLEAVDARQHHVQQGHQGVRIGVELIQGLLAGLGLHHLIARPAQVDDDKTADAGFILQDHYLSHGSDVPFFRFYAPHRATIRLKHWRRVSSSRRQEAAPSSSSPA